MPQRFQTRNVFCLLVQPYKSFHFSIKRQDIKLFASEDDESCFKSLSLAVERFAEILDT